MGLTVRARKLVVSEDEGRARLAGLAPFRVQLLVASVDRFLKNGSGF